MFNLEPIYCPPSLSIPHIPKGYWISSQLGLLSVQDSQFFVHPSDKGDPLDE